MSRHKPPRRRDEDAAARSDRGVRGGRSGDRGRPRATPKGSPRGRGRRSALWPVTLGILGVGAVLNVGIILFTGRGGGGAAPVPAETQSVVARGEALYRSTCASCHGDAGQGYAIRGVPAPALNATEHAWHHPDDQILGLLRQGGVQMPAVGAGWSEADLEAVLTYVKQWWTPQQRRAQAGTIGE